MWEYNTVPVPLPVDTVPTFAYQLRKGDRIHRPNSTPLRVESRTDEFEKGDVVLTVRLWNTDWSRWSFVTATMRVNMLARFELTP